MVELWCEVAKVSCSKKVNDKKYPRRRCRELLLNEAFDLSINLPIPFPILGIQHSSCVMATIGSCSGVLTNTK